MTYDFDTPIDRGGTCAMKLEALPEMFGRTDVTPLWIADMDFAVCPEINKALNSRCNHPVLGYCSTPVILAPYILSLSLSRGFTVCTLITPT